MILKTDDRVFQVGFRYSPADVLPRRATACRIVEFYGPDQTRTIGYGIARCSELDQFEKAKGRKLALARAMATASLDRETRTQLWAQFHRQVRRPCLS